MERNCKWKSREIIKFHQLSLTKKFDIFRDGKFHLWWQQKGTCLITCKWISRNVNKRIRNVFDFWLQSLILNFSFSSSRIFNPKIVRWETARKKTLKKDTKTEQKKFLFATVIWCEISLRCPRCPRHLIIKANRLHES